MQTLPVAEVFGPTFQGEGPYSGQRASFVRFGGCNLSCSWCDTPYTWDARRYDLRAEISSRTSADVLEDLNHREGIVVLTGGEPLLYARQPAFLELLEGLRATRRSVHVESNGTLAPASEVLDLLDVIVLSPKLANAGRHRGRQTARIATAWQEISSNHEVHLKFVCLSRDDVAEAVLLAEGLNWPKSRVWVMPEGDSREQIDRRWREIAEAAIEFGVSASTRLHVLAWGNSRRR